MEHATHPELLTRPVRVLVVGCGTQGTAVGTSLPYVHRLLLAHGHPAGLDVVFQDDDTVSFGSCRTQPFRQADVGEFRSVVLAERLNAGWDVSWRAATESLAHQGSLEGIDIVIGCATMAASRAAIATLASGAAEVGYWLDLASNARGSQFVLGEPLNRRNPRSRERLRVAPEFFPEILDASFDQAMDDVDGTRRQADEGYEAFASQIVASHALMLLGRLLKDGTISHHGAFLGPRGALRLMPVGRLPVPRTEERVIDYE